MSRPYVFVSGLAAGLLLALAVREFVWKRSQPAQALPSSVRPGSWRGKRVLVTGASSGIGRACAVHFASLGASVAIHYNRSRGGAEETLRTCLSTGGGGLFLALQADLSSGSSAGLFDAAVAGLGGVDVLVLNAGVYEEQGAMVRDNLPAFREQFHRVLATNLASAAELLFAAGCYFSQRRVQEADFFQRAPPRAQAAIVAVGSRGALRGEPNAWAYGAAKAGLHALVQSAAVSLGGLGVSCSAVAPGWVDTPMAQQSLQGPGGEGIRQQSPWGRVASATEVAAAVEGLARFWETAFCTGAVLDCNGASYLH
jgi:3-oxoacyl-[acyl-carrier protein] reductase